MATRERWGTFSVKDHLRPQAFVADLLLFDQLVIPYPVNEKERSRWHDLHWNPDALDKTLEVLGDKATRFDWYEDLFKDRFAANKVEQFNKEELVNARQSGTDPFYTTRQIVAEAELAKHADDEIKVWTLPAYPSKQTFIDHKGQTPEEQKTLLAAVIANKFLTPDGPEKFHEELLKDTLALSKDSDFLKKRWALNEWQEEMFNKEFTTKQAIHEMEERLREYNGLVKKANKNVIEKVAFLAVEVALGLAGAHLGEPVATAGAMVSVARFWKFERKPEINSGDPSFVASMIYDAQQSLHFETIP